MIRSKRFYANLQSRSYTAAVYNKFSELSESQQNFMKSVVFKAISDATIENRAGIVPDLVHGWVVSDLRRNAPAFDVAKVTVYIAPTISALVEQGKLSVESTRFCKLLTIA